MLRNARNELPLSEAEADTDTEAEADKRKRRLFVGKRRGAEKRKRGTVVRGLLDGSGPPQNYTTNPNASR